MVDLKPPNTPNMKSPMQAQTHIATGATITSISPYLKPSYDESQFCSPNPPLDIHIVQDLVNRPFNMDRKSKDISQTTVRIPVNITNCITTIVLQVKNHIKDNPFQHPRNSQSGSNLAVVNRCLEYSVQYIHDLEDVQTYAECMEWIRLATIDSDEDGIVQLDNVISTLTHVSVSFVSMPSIRSTIFMHDEMSDKVGGLAGKLGMSRESVVLLCVIHVLSMQPDGVINSEWRGKMRSMYRGFERRIAFMAKISKALKEF
jgi:hypothetical protein